MLEREVQERLYDALIHVGAEDSVRDGWCRAECDVCSWYTTGLESVVEDAGYEHVSEVHMAMFVEIVVPAVSAALADSKGRVVEP